MNLSQFTKIIWSERTSLGSQYSDWLSFSDSGSKMAHWFLYSPLQIGFGPKVVHYEGNRVQCGTNTGSASWIHSGWCHSEHILAILTDTHKPLHSLIWKYGYSYFMFWLWREEE
jgi:hypothetical protein